MIKIKDFKEELYIFVIIFFIDIFIQIISYEIFGFSSLIDLSIPFAPIFGLLLGPFAAFSVALSTIVVDVFLYA